MRKLCLIITVAIAFSTSVQAGANCRKWTDEYFFEGISITDVNKCLNEGADPNAKGVEGWAPILDAAGTGNTEAVKVLLNAGADPNVQDSYYWTPLILAAMKGRQEMVEALLNAGADLETLQKDTGGTALLHASDFETIKTLIDAGADIEARFKNDGDTALHSAARSGNVDRVEYLLDAGADKNVKNKKGQTPFDLAHEDLKGTGTYLRLNDAQ